MRAPRILIVEDEKLAAKHIKMSLTELGYEVIRIVASGEDAVAGIEDPLPDLVLMDVMLEGDMDGIEAANLITSRVDVPVVFLTAYSDEALLKRARLTEPFGYLLKPFREEELRTTIEMALFKHKVGKEAQTKTELIIRQRTEELLRTNEQLKKEINERKRIEDALRESEGRFRILVETAPFGLSIMNMDGEFEYLNPRFTQIFGYTLEDLPTQDAFLTKTAAKPEADHQCGIPLKDSCLTTGLIEARHELFSVTAGDGTVRIVSSLESTLDCGRLTTYQDVTTEVAAVKEISRAKEEWERTFDAVPDLIMILSRDQRIIRANRALAETYEVPVKSMPGQYCYHVLHGTDRPPPSCPHALMLRDGKEHSLDFHEAGKGLTFHLTVSPLHDCNGEPIGSVHVTRDITERKRMEAEKEKLIVELEATRDALQYLATRDGLTHLWNRREIINILENELARSRREDTGLSLILLDLDDFKRINDRHGHLAGDAALQSAAQRIRTMVRPYDAVGRYGGEEFIVVLPDTREEEAFAVAERLRDAFSANPLRTDDGDFPVTVSGGVAAKDPGTEIGSAEVIRAADDALYRAKNKGRNLVERAGRIGNGVEPAGGF